jgi:hypothetical protein
MAIPPIGERSGSGLAAAKIDAAEARRADAVVLRKADRRSIARVRALRLDDCRWLFLLAALLRSVTPLLSMCQT